MKIAVLICFLFMQMVSSAQSNNDLSFFEPLIGNVWVAEGQWGDGTPYRQEIRYEYDLNKKIVQTYTNGFINEDMTAWGKRNHGIRKWDEKTKKYMFWEYDVFGGITEGEVFVEGDNIYHQYVYGEAGKQTNITDGLEKIDENTYAYKIGVYNNGKWAQVFLDTKFKALPIFSGERSDLDAILDKVSRFSETYMNEDHEGIAQFYTENGKIMPGGTKIIEGRKAIAERWKLPEDSDVILHKVTPTEISIEGNTAYDYGYYEGRSKNPKGEVSDWKGKYVIIWKKIGGEWLIEVDIWNGVNG